MVKLFILSILLSYYQRKETKYDTKVNKDRGVLSYSLKIRTMLVLSEQGENYWKVDNREGMLYFERHYQLYFHMFIKQYEVGLICAAKFFYYYISSFRQCDLFWFKCDELFKIFNCLIFQQTRLLFTCMQHFHPHSIVM